MKLLVITVFALLLASCASIARHGFYDGVNPESVYCGTKDDYREIISVGKSGRGDDSVAWWIAFLPFVIIDLPLSVISDTVFLPFDLLSDGK